MNFQLKRPIIDPSVAKQSLESDNRSAMDILSGDTADYWSVIGQSKFWVRQSIGDWLINQFSISICDRWAVHELKNLKNSVSAIRLVPPVKISMWKKIKKKITALVFTDFSSDGTQIYGRDLRFFSENRRRWSDVWFTVLLILRRQYYSIGFKKAY